MLGAEPGFFVHWFAAGSGSSTMMELAFRSHIPGIQTPE